MLPRLPAVLSGLLYRFLKAADPEVSAKTAAGIATFRQAAEEALTATGLHLAEGHHIWQLYRCGALAGSSSRSGRKLSEYMAQQCCYGVLCDNGTPASAGMGARATAGPAFLQGGHMQLQVATLTSNRQHAAVGTFAGWVVVHTHVATGPSPCNMQAWHPQLRWRQHVAAL